MEELVAAVDSLQRYAVSEGLAAVLGSVPAALSRSAIGALGPWRPLLLPLPTPLELLTRFEISRSLSRSRHFFMTCVFSFLWRVKSRVHGSP